MIRRVDDEDAIMIVIDRETVRIVELAWLLSSLAELGHEREAFVSIITREYLHSMIERIGDEQETSVMVERQASRHIEQAIVMALLDGTNRAHDSSMHTITTVRLIEMIAHDIARNARVCDGCTNERQIQRQRGDEVKNSTASPYRVWASRTEPTTSRQLCDLSTSIPIHMTSAGYSGPSRGLGHAIAIHRRISSTRSLPPVQQNEALQEEPNASTLSLSLSLSLSQIGRAHV